jgi:hypothetical protein
LLLSDDQKDRRFQRYHARVGINSHLNHIV